MPTLQAVQQEATCQQAPCRQHLVLLVAGEGCQVAVFADGVERVGAAMRDQLDQQRLVQGTQKQAQVLRDANSEARNPSK